MYNLPYYKEHDERVVDEFIAAHPFAFLTGCDSDSMPVATQVPVCVIEKNGRKMLVGHIMKNTDHHKAFLQNANVLVVFTGPHSYVSARWYSDPKVASTWNYMSVHAKGRIRFLDQDGLEGVLQRTSLRFENNDQHSPTVFSNLPSEFRRKVMNAIVGFEIELTGLDTVFKLSQEKDDASFLKIIDELEKQGESARAIAAQMKLREKSIVRKN